jgi:hypothetical protein
MQNQDKIIDGELLSYYILSRHIDETSRSYLTKTSKMPT